MFKSKSEESIAIDFKNSFYLCSLDYLWVESSSEILINGIDRWLWGGGGRRRSSSTFSQSCGGVRRRSPFFFFFTFATRRRSASRSIFIALALMTWWGLSMFSIFIVAITGWKSSAIAICIGGLRRSSLSSFSRSPWREGLRLYQSPSLWRLSRVKGLRRSPLHFVRSFWSLWRSSLSEVCRRLQSSSSAMYDGGRWRLPWFLLSPSRGEGLRRSSSS